MSFSVLWQLDVRRVFCVCGDTQIEPQSSNQTRVCVYCRPQYPGSSPTTEMPSAQKGFSMPIGTKF